MERVGIVEMADMEAESAPQSKQEIIQMIVINDFSMIQEGFTGIYLRECEFQIVPNELVPKIKEVSSGFAHVPEDHELILFSEWRDPEGIRIRKAISDMVTEWTDSIML